MSAKSDPLQGLAPGVILQGVAEAVATPAPRPPPIAAERPEEELPDTDGKPMADNSWQAITMHYAGTALAIHFQGRGFVATDLLVYYLKDGERESVAPDVMVVLGVDGSLRRSYSIWKEGGRAPDFVLEVVSNSTQERDAKDKRRTYAELGVREYFRYAPVSRRMDGMGGRRLVGEVLRDGWWEALPRLGLERIRSAVLGLDLRVRERDTGDGFRELRLFDPIAGEDLRTHEKSERDRREAEHGREQERQSRIRAERARAEERQSRIRAERARAEERQGRIRAERAHAESEREIARLRAMLEQLRGAGAGDASSDST